ncbi:HdeD family acid-resistance protein [Haloarchaeobius sp. TZWSO28]|uniref:HdeD family acid-resistance protein n=1 Tax=Haloarchaeobius sp. TZWSO28 TaxID=3446119 RepID=UPI003EBF409A
MSNDKVPEDESTEKSVTETVTEEATEFEAEMEETVTEQAAEMEETATEKMTEMEETATEVAEDLSELMEEPPVDAPQADLASSYTTAIGVGAVLAILGFLAIVFPIFTSLSLTVVFGAALVVGAFVQIAHAFSAKKWTGFLGQTVLALVYGVAGITVLANPVLGLASLTFLLIGYFFASGIVQLAMGVKTRGQPNWGWLLFSGGLGILVGVMLFLGLPSTAAWAVGLLFGANLLASGLSMIMLAVGAKEAAEAGEVTPPTAKPGGV